MRIVKPSTVRAFWAKHPDAEPFLENWLKVTHAAHWMSLQEVRRTLPHADAVKVGSGGIVTVFNVGGNKYRPLTAIHYNTGMVFILGILPHEQYSRGGWKDRL
jgi:mRNA interferase HigB